MKLDLEKLPKNIDALHQIIATLETENSLLQASWASEKESLQLEKDALIVRFTDTVSIFDVELSLIPDLKYQSLD